LVRRVHVQQRHGTNKLVLSDNRCSNINNQKYRKKKNTLFFLSHQSTTTTETLSRTLVLVTAMGLSIMVAKLEGAQRIKIVLLTVAYGLCSFAFDLLQVLERNEASGQKFSLLFLMAVAILDVIFYYWTFLSLSILLKQLSTRARNKLALAKMTLYKQLWWILIVTAVFSALLIAAQVIIPPLC
jgi:hypothetical protein